MPGIWQQSINVKLMNEFPKVIDWFITKAKDSWPIAFTAGGIEEEKKRKQLS